SLESRLLRYELGCCSAQGTEAHLSRVSADEDSDVASHLLDGETNRAPHRQAGEGDTGGRPGDQWAPGDGLLQGWAERCGACQGLLLLRRQHDHGSRRGEREHPDLLAALLMRCTWRWIVAVVLAGWFAGCAKPARTPHDV